MTVADLARARTSQTIAAALSLAARRAGREPPR